MPSVSRNPLEILARAGYGARGVVYGLVGGLALLAAIGSGDRRAAAAAPFNPSCRNRSARSGSR